MFPSFGQRPYTNASWRRGEYGLRPINDYLTSENNNIGFRVASIPEPSSLLLAALSAAGLFLPRRVRESLGGTGTLLQKHRGGYAEVLAE